MYAVIFLNLFVFASKQASYTAINTALTLFRRFIFYFYKFLLLIHSGVHLPQGTSTRILYGE